MCVVMSMHPKEKELVAIGISVATGCRPCTDHHVKVARKARASDDEIKQAMDDALIVRRRAADIMEVYATAHLGENLETIDPGLAGEPSRIRVIVAVGAAFAVNCVATLEHYLAAADRAGISQDDLFETIELAKFIKAKAASHVDRLIGPSEEAA